MHVCSLLVAVCGVPRSDGPCCRHVAASEGLSAVVAEDGVELLRDPDEGGPAAQLLQFARTDVGAGGADPAQDVSYRPLHRAFVRDLHCLPLRSSGGGKKKKKKTHFDYPLRHCLLRTARSPI